MTTAFPTARPAYRRGKGEGEFDRVLGAAAVAPRLILVDDEAAADREIHALGENFAVTVALGEAQGIAVKRLALLHLEMQVTLRLKAHALTAEQVEEAFAFRAVPMRLDKSEEHTSELQSLMRISYA